MKKTVTINVSGIIFHIDEDAFDKLASYLETIKSRFTQAEGRDEIIADIESRIAELLQGKINPAKQVITIEDISDVIAVMGEPEQIGEESATGHKEKDNAQHKSHKRLFRDPDNKVLGGVCGGIGAYFNIDPIWIRIGFVAALFLFGTGPLLYLILWVIIPQAASTAERLQMRGEPVNISNIEKSIREEVDQLKERLKNLKDEAKTAYKTNIRHIQPQTTAEKVLGFLLILAKYFVRALAVLIGIIFIVVGIFLITGFISSFFHSKEVIWISSIGISNFSFPVFLQLFLGSSQMITVALIGLALFIGIPLIMLVYNGIKLIFGIRSSKRIVGISTLSLWFAGLILCIIVGLSILNSFSHKSSVTDKVEITQPVAGMLKVYVQKDAVSDSVSDYENKFVIGQWNMVSLQNRSLRFGMPELVVVRSNNEFYEVQIMYSAKGKTRDDAMQCISRIKYKIADKDTAIVLDPFYTLPENEKWRAQNIKVIIKVPLWKGIYLSPETSPLLRYKTEDFDYNKDLSGKKWIMTENGLREYAVSMHEYMAVDSVKTLAGDSLKRR